MNKPSDAEQLECLRWDLSKWRFSKTCISNREDELDELWHDLNTPCPYGKHRGRILLCVPVKYLDGQFHTMDDGIFKFTVERILRSDIAARMYRAGAMDKSIGEFVYHVRWKYDYRTDDDVETIRVTDAALQNVRDAIVMAVRDGITDAALQNVRDAIKAATEAA